jgi:autotransporter translocation and assembly factor TamB
MRGLAAKAGAIFGRIVAALLVLALVLVILVAFLLRTTPGHRLLTRIALPYLNGKMAGHISLGALDGELPGHIILRDARLDDAEGFETIFARRVEARIDVRALLHEKIRVTDLRVEGGRLVMRHLVDNRFNLAALAKPKTAAQEAKEQKEQQEKAQKKSSPPPLVTIEHFHLQLEGAYFPPRGHETHRIEWPKGTFDIDGDAWFRGSDMHFTVAHFVSDSAAPFAAHVELRAGLRVGPKNEFGKTELTFEKVHVTVATDGAELAKLVPGLNAKGRWSLVADGGGPLANLAASAVLSPPAGHLAVEGQMSRLKVGVRWRALVDLTGFDPGRNFERLPSGDLALSLRGRGEGNEGELILDALRGTMPGVTLDGSGRSDFSGRGHGAIALHVSELGKVWPPATREKREPGAIEKLRGAVDVVAELARDADGPRLVADVEARGIGVRQAQVDALVKHATARLQIAARQKPLVTLQAQEILVAPASTERAREKRAGRIARLPPTGTTSEAPSGSSAAAKTAPYVHLTTLALTARGVPSSLALSLTAAMADGLRAATELHASLAPGGKASARIARLTIDKGATHYALPEPADVDVAMRGDAVDARLAVAGLRAVAHTALRKDRVIVDVHAASKNLARLTAGTKLTLGGAFTFDGKLELGERLRIIADAEATQLSAGPVSIARVTLHADTRDLQGRVALHVDSLRARQLIFSRLDLRARAGDEQLAFTLDGERPYRRGALRVGIDVAGRFQTRKLAVTSADLIIRKLGVTVPEQAWTLQRPARIVVGKDGLTLTSLRIASPAGTRLGELEMAARVFPSHAVDIVVQLQNGQLQELGRFIGGRDDFLPAARWSGHVRLRGTPSAPLVDAALTAQAERTVAWYGLAFNSLVLTAYGDKRGGMLHVEARGKDDNRIAVDVHANPSADLKTLDATIDRFGVTVNHHSWQLRDPCHLAIAPVLEIRQCKLGSGKAEVAVGGTLPLVDASAPLSLVLTTRRLDLRDLGALAAPGHKEPPKTSFDARLQVSGTRKAPIAELELSGTGSQVDEGLPENVRYQISARYAEKRIKGQASMRQVGVRLGVGARFDVPIALEPEAPLSLEVEARPVPFFKIRDLLPPALANMQGFFTLRLRAGGTTRHPTLSAELHAPSWGLDDLRDNDTIVDVAYDGDQLTLNSVTSFEATSLVASILRIKPKRNAGTIKTAAKVHVDLMRLLRDPKHAYQSFARGAPIAASAELRSVDLTKVPMQILGFAPAVTSGIVDGSLRMTGTLARPSLHAELHGRELAKTGSLQHADAEAKVAWDDGRAQVSGRLMLFAAPLLSWRGYVALDGEQLFGGGLANAGLAIDVDAPELLLSRVSLLQPRLHGLEGALAAHAAVRGTVGNPELHVEAAGRGLHVGEERFAKARVEASYARATWKFSLAAAEEQGGTLALGGTVARNPAAPLDVRLAARGLDVGFLSAAWEEIGELHGTADGDVVISGTRAAPRLAGKLRLDRGRFGLRWDARRYVDGDFDLVFDGSEINLRRFSLRSDGRGGGGTLTAHGTATLDGGGTLLRIDVAAHADKFIAGYGSATAWLDADFKLQGDRRRGDRWDGAILLQRGAIKLPDLDGGLPGALGRALPDVALVDKRPPPDAKLPSLTMLLRVDHPLALTSKEADLHLAGELVAAVDGQRRLEGVIEAADDRGTMELLGHRYRVERAQLAFTGPPDDPELHLRATRKLGAATLALVIEGTAKHPAVRLECDPPIYDQTQLVSLVLAGRPNEDRVTVHDLESQVGGVLSALVIRKIEQQLAPSLPIDVVRPLDQQSYAELSQAPLEVGRYVSDRIYVSYAHQAGSRMGRSAANSEEARAEYRLGGGWELATTFGDQGVGGVFLMWTAKK